MKPLSNWVVNLLLCLASFSFCFILFEIACRIVPWAGCDELQINNPYRIRRLRSSAIFEEDYFIENFKSLVELKKAVNEKEIQLYVVLIKPLNEC